MKVSNFASLQTLMSPSRIKTPPTKEYNIFRENIRFAGHKMANSLDLLTKINDEFLTCQICFETYTCPKSLNCQHTFCKKCLQDYLTPNASALLCPTCRSAQPLTSEGIQGLKDNFFISSMSDMLKTVKEISSDSPEGTSLLCDTCDEDCRMSATARCLDCTDFLCSDCATWHRRTKLTRGHKIVSLSEFESGMHNKELKSRAKIYCLLHEGEAAKIYCVTCQCPICHECVESSHSSHERCSLKEEVKNQSLQVEKLLSSATDKTDVLRDMQRSMQELKQLKRRMCDQAESTISRTCQTFIAAIERKKQELMDEVQKLHANEIKQINADEDSVDMQLSSLVSCSEFSRKVLEYGTPKEVLGLNKQMTQILQQLLETHPALRYHKEDHTDQVQFVSEPEDLKAVSHLLGKIDMAKTPLTDSINKILRQLDSFCIVTPGTTIQRSSVSRLQSVESMETKLLKQIGKQGIDDGDFESTPNIAVNSVGEIITSDSEACRIQIFDPHGHFKDSFKTEVNGKLLRPSDLAILRNDDIAVCCEDQVYIWTHEGKKVVGFGKEKCVSCSSVAVDSSNRIIVTDVAKHCVNVYKDNGTFIFQFGAAGTISDGKLIEPRYVTCDSKSNIIISDSGDCCIKKFDSKGEFLHSFGGEGADRGLFQGPRGVTVDENDNIIVADCWNHRVDMFTSEGVFTRHIATDVEGLHFPWSIALTTAGKLVLSEDYGWSVKIFRLPDYRKSSMSSAEDITSPTMLIPDLEQLAGHFDMSNIINSKLSRWLNSPGANSTDLSQTLKGTSSGNSILAGKPAKRPNRSKSLTGKKSSSSDSDLTSGTIAALLSPRAPHAPPPTPYPPGEHDILNGSLAASEVFNNQIPHGHVTMKAPVVNGS